jgi:hypothetical protein
MILEDFLLPVFAGPSDQFLRNSAMEFRVNAGSANSGSFRRLNHPFCQPLFELVKVTGM